MSLKKFYSLYPAIVIIHMSDYQAKLYRYSDNF